MLSISRLVILIKYISIIRIIIRSYIRMKIIAIFNYIKQYNLNLVSKRKENKAEILKLYNNLYYIEEYKNRTQNIPKKITQKCNFLTKIQFFKKIKKALHAPILGCGADKGTRTPTVAHQILSLARLPISPYPLASVILSQYAAGVN